MPTSFDSLDSAGLRDYYEQQGSAARNAGGLIDCSEPTITEIVVRMATERADDFQNLLDVGCGANLLYDRALLKLGKQVVGVDFTWNFLKLIGADSGVPVLQADAVNLPFPSESFDAVICSETAEHIRDDAAVVRELARVLRPNGWLFFTVPNLWNAARLLEMIRKLDTRVTLMPGHLREYTRKDVSDLLSRYFRIEELYPVGFGWTGGSVGSCVELLVRRGILARFSKSIAVAARKF
jgi:SAM-dependent methyltransferase